MKMFNYLSALILMLFMSITVSAQSNGEPTYYQVVFTEIDQFQLKELVPVCSEIFVASAENKGEPNVLYFNSELTMTPELLKQKLTEKNIDYIFELKIIENEKY